jgi:hypothetical protein
MRLFLRVSIVLLVALAAGANLPAQCGGSVGGSVVYCCGTPVFLSAEWAAGGKSGQLTENCPVADCPGFVVFAGGTCFAPPLQGSVTREQLDRLSEQMPLLVASCTGGFVPYESSLSNVPSNRKLVLRLPTLRLTGSGR